ncbi:LuxR C-terminal-related transcriptional regulator [Streptomyces sp. SPB162]|uniref:LuxR C-terminal-related transcriptional regulator n=1 Tax=Streptomyces sp. SPB162 TaxID=2940560 RepID=UPI0024052A18|nr:LuxR C-terminal-related transcriptional regulator [Streptomyces sp. SPB162]MDF9811676.1 DNA-binding NarL/FixJ family response regulator [Streptomyces sp. SPB162]
MTALAPTQPLTPSEQRIAQHVIKGLDAREIAAATQLKPNTVHSTLRTVRWKLACPERCSLTVVAHRLVVLAHSWQLLPAEHAAHATRSGATQ